jgi:hypothetical protein
MRGSGRCRMRPWLTWLLQRERSDRWARITGTGMLITALGLACWSFYLGASLPDAGPAQDWSTASLTGLGNWQLTWVGLDIMEVAGLAATGYLLRRSHRQTRTAALLAAPLFVADGWFDILTEASRSGMALSVAMLGLAELPAAIFLVLIARKAREFESDHSGYHTEPRHELADTPAGLPQSAASTEP